MATRSTEPDTDEDVGARQTRRQKRIEEQRRKIDGMRREQRQKQLIWGAVIVVMVLVVAGLFFFLRRPGSSVAADQDSQGRFIAAVGEASHVPVGTVVQYNSRPPTSGSHYETPSGYGVFDRAIPTGNWVHNLEHGGIVVLYRPDLCDATCVTAVKDVYSQAPKSRLFNVVKMVVTPYTDMDHAVAVVAWQWLDEMDTADKGRILAFYRDHVDRGPEQAL